MPNLLNLRVAAYLILRRDSEILLLRRFNTGYEDGKYSLIAGHVEHSESPSQAIVREAREEAGVEVAFQDLRFVKVVHRKCPDNVVFVDYYFEASRWSGEPRIAEPDKCDALDWVRADALPGDIIPCIKSVLDGCGQQSVALLEYGW
jgi:8-oxo-dGTP diphosphatase